ncbi:MAG TPA: response regulator transcription factor [Kineosporiaceae bacterium]|nr:response regulator transcription factor [Kineosporiaceae bacterium]
MRVLVVDDEVRFAQSLQRGLRAEGFDVDLAHDGETGLRLARDGGYDAVVLDIMLPRLSGYRVTERLRADGNDVPVLMLSAKDGEYDQADGLDLGADDYLTKPFAWVVFVARLKALLRRATGRGGPAVSAEPVAAGDLVLDPSTHTVNRGGTPIALTAREFDLLEHLLRAGGRTVPKTELLSAVWGGLAHDDPNVVEVYVGYLRRKIDQPFGRHSLLTVRGVGYRLVPDEQPDEQPDEDPGGARAG